MKPALLALAAGVAAFLSACPSAAPSGVPPRTFATSFEQVEDFAGFYLVPPGDYDSSHALTTDRAVGGLRSHRAWILQARAANNDGLEYRPHRAYPTIQLHKTPGGGFRTPCLVTFWVYVDMNLVDRPQGAIDDWFSLATLSPDASDGWNRTILVNLVPDGYLRLVHVPDQGKQEHGYQAGPDNDPTGSLKFPYREWVKVTVYLDLAASGGSAKVWQNGQLVSTAAVRGGHGKLEQAHFGLYASAAIPAGEVFNDDLTIREVDSEPGTQGE